MTIFSSTQPSLRARVLPRFPAQVLAGNGIQITKSGAAYTFALASPLNLPVTSLQQIPSDRLLGRDTSGTGPVEILTGTDGLSFNGAGGLGMSLNQRLRTLPFIIRGGTDAAGAAIGTGIKGDILVPFACTINKVTLLADQNTGGTAFQLDIWKDTFANYPPTVADTITASNKPIIASGANKVQNTTLTGWTTAIAAGDILRFNVDTTSTVQRVGVYIDVTAT